MKDDKLKDLIRDSIDKELDNIVFSEERKDRVLEEISTPKSFLSRFLNYELTIPLKPIVAVTTALFIGIGYMTYPFVRVDEEDILKSKIEVIRFNE